MKNLRFTTILCWLFGHKPKGVPGSLNIRTWYFDRVYCKRCKKQLM